MAEIVNDSSNSNVIEVVDNLDDIGIEDLFLLKKAKESTKLSRYEKIAVKYGNITVKFFINQLQR